MSSTQISTTPRTVAFLDYWRQYRDDIDEIAARARRIALRDGRTMICRNDAEAAWTQIVGPLAVYGS